MQGHQDGYLHAVKSEKKEIARSIVATIRSRGGRFLRKCTDGRVGWLEIGDKKAREKTSQALREGLDAKTLLSKGIVKADLLAEIASASEGPPPTKRRRCSLDADVEAGNQQQLLQLEQEAMHVVQTRDPLVRTQQMQEMQAMTRWLLQQRPQTRLHVLPVQSWSQRLLPPTTIMVASSA